jgi:hypothetical protein
MPASYPAIASLNSRWRLVSGWLSSLLFWTSLLSSAALFATVSLSPAICESIRLDGDLAERRRQNAALSEDVQQLQRLEQTLLHDRRFMAELRQREWKASSPAIVTLPDLPKDAGEPPAAESAGAATEWYHAVAVELSRSTALRRQCLTAAILLCLFGFVCLPVRD